MSLLTNEERPKLKARRFNKFESSSTAPETEPENNISKQGVKRRGNDDETYSFNSKRMCNRNLNVSPVKNLANNRLKKLKEEIQASVEATNVNEQNNVPAKPQFRPSGSGKAKNVYERVNKSVSETDVGPKFTNNSPVDSSKKNLAAERLQNIKKKLYSTDTKAKQSSNTRNKTLNLPCSSTEKTTESNNLKRSVSCIVNSCDYGSTPTKKASTKGLSPLKFDNISKPSIVEHINLNSVSYNSSIFCSTPISKESKTKNKNNVECSNEEVKKSQYNRTSHGWPETRKKDSTINDQNHTTSKSICQVSREAGSSSKLPSDGGNSFLSKMEMTASWIRNHQVGTHCDSFMKPLDTPVIETTKESHNVTKFCDDSEEMEWTNAEPDDEVIDPHKIVNETSKEEDKEIKEVIKDPEKIKDVCVVVDTNVFISGLSKLQDIINLKTTGTSKPIIYIPWMVITELDFMKDKCSNTKLLKNITSAIKFINAALKNKNTQVVAQSVFDVEKQKHIGTSPDDKIIACCLQASEKYETVILLSNDLNLKNKAMINDISACSSNEIIMKLMLRMVKNTKTRKIMHKMGVMCSSIICECMKSTYGDIWLKMDMMSCPPWSLQECLKRFKKYWTTVFSEKLMKQFTKTLQNLQGLIDGNKCIADDSADFIEFMKLCVTLCIFLKDIEECRGFVENTIGDITKAAQ